jgi:CRP/FNR family transcriptional regulator, cyclic AMP receptor protein
MSRTASAAILAQISKAARDDPERMGADWVPVLQGVPLFANLSQRHLRHVAKLASAVRFSPGAPVVRAGAPGNSFFVVIDGSARVEWSGGSSRLGPLDFFGEMSLIDGGPRSATVVAETDMLTMKLSRSGFAKVLESEPDIALVIMKELVRRVRQAEGSPTA